MTTTKSSATSTAETYPIKYDRPAARNWPDPRAYLKAIRPVHWLKNLLVFLPAFAAHQILNPAVLWASCLVFCCFSLIASGIYVINDLIDLEADKAHPQKCHRPIAAGRISFSSATILAVGLLFSGFCISIWRLPHSTTMILALYVIANFAYSIVAKKVAIFDIVLLSQLYNLRVFAGAAATGITVSEWLLGFATFLFFSLAFAKRFAELIRLSKSIQVSPQGRGYHVDDLDTLKSLGIASGYVAIVVLALYTNSETVATLYRYPQALWLVLIGLLYWISRLWLIAGRGELNEDPLLFVAKDMNSWLVALSSLAVVYFSSSPR